MLKKYLQDFFSYQASHILGGRKYTDWAKETLVLHKNIPIKNTKLAQELEDACQKNGFLTYAQFLTIDQFGTYGYHNTHKEHGMTDVRSRWPEALAALCKKKQIHHIVEFGPGDGQVGILTIKQAKKIHHELLWSGVEINEQLTTQTRKLFQKNDLQNKLLQLVSTIQELQLSEKCLFVFSYSIDNLIPDVFINTSGQQSYPNAMVGITVKNGLLSEILVPSPVIPAEAGIQKNRPRIKSGMTTNETLGLLKNGVFKDSFGYTWDLSHWQLNTMQRVYLPLDACRILLEAVHAMPKDSQILIIDEFRAPSQKQTYHIGLPRDLETYSRDFTDFEKFYKTAGSNLLYFPPFVDTITSFLSELGFSLEENCEEHKLAYLLSERNSPYPKHSRTFALLTSAKKSDVKRKKCIISAPIA